VNASESISSNSNCGRIQSAVKDLEAREFSEATAEFRCLNLWAGEARSGDVGSSWDRHELRSTLLWEELGGVSKFALQPGCAPEQSPHRRTFSGVQH